MLKSQSIFADLDDLDGFIGPWKFLRRLSSMTTCQSIPNVKAIAFFNFQIINKAYGFFAVFKRFWGEKTTWIWFVYGWSCVLIKRLVNSWQHLNVSLQYILNNEIDKEFHSLIYCSQNWLKSIVFCSCIDVTLYCRWQKIKQTYSDWFNFVMTKWIGVAIFQILIAIMSKLH